MEKDTDSFLRIISINDVYELTLLPHFASAVKSHKTDQTIVLLPGDFLAPSLLSSLDHGRAMIESLNRCGVDFVCFGNHETDIPHADLMSRISESKFEWINTNMQDLKLPSNITLPSYRIIQLMNGRKIALLGLLTDDKGLYRPGSFAGATIQPVVSTAEKYIEILESEGVDLIIPMTHQIIQFDRDFMRKFEKNRAEPPLIESASPSAQVASPDSEQRIIDNENVFPLIIGGHDHEPYVETLHGSTIVKVGSDARMFSVCDVHWPSSESSQVEVRVKVYDTSHYPPDPSLEEYVRTQSTKISELDHAPLFRAGPKHNLLLSSKGTRLGQTSMGRFLASSMRDALDADCGIMHAGSVRADIDYDDPTFSYFSYSQLKAEIPFDTEVVLIPMPGQVLADTIQYSHKYAYQTPPKSFGGYFQVDDRVMIDEERNLVTHINGLPLDPDHTYMVAIPFLAAMGGDDIQPLKEYIKSNLHLFPSESVAEMGRPIKTLLVTYFSRSIWYEMGTFSELDRENKQSISYEDMKIAVSKLFQTDVSDISLHNIWHAAHCFKKEGEISPEEFLRLHLFSEHARRDITHHPDGGISREDLEAFACRVVGERLGGEIADRLFDELDREKLGRINKHEIQHWLSRNMEIDAVDIPGQDIVERKEIAAVRTKLKILNQS